MSEIFWVASTNLIQENRDGQDTRASGLCTGNSNKLVQKYQPTRIFVRSLYYIFALKYKGYIR